MSLGIVSNLAADTSCTNVQSGDKTNNFCTNLPQPPASADNLQNLVHIVFGILAVIVVLVIVIAAFNIVTAGGDASKVAKARSNILYALIGLVIAVSADVIVSIIITRLK